MGGGYVFKMKDTSTQSVENQTLYLEKSSWIDKQTAAVFIEFTLFNPNINLFQSCMILFEILPSGSFLNTAQFKPIDVYDLKNSALLSFKIIINIVYLIFVSLLLISEVRDLNKKGRKYFLDFYNYIEMFIIAFSWAAFAMYLYRLYASFAIYSRLSPTNLNQDSFINLQYITTCDALFTMFLAFCSAFATLRFIKLLRFIKRIIIFFEAFKKSLNELASFGLIFLIIWMSFVQVFYFMLNSESIQFSTLINSMATCFQIILGKFDSRTFYNSESLLAPYLFVAYNVFVVFVMVNLLVSILVDYLELELQNESLDREDPEMWNYLKASIKDWLCFSKRDESPVYLDYWDALPIRFEDYLQRFKLIKTQ